MPNKWGLILLFFLFTQFSLKAQPAHSRALQVQQLYESLQFEKAIDLSHQLLRTPQKFTKDDLLLIHQFTAYAFFNLGKPDSARKHFVTILAMDPNYQLDSVTTSPKIVRYFNDLKRTLKDRTVETKIAYIRYIFVEDRRPGAAWRSALLPGWGQWYKGQKKKALWTGTAFGLSATFTVAAALLEKHYHQKYRDSKLPSAISKNYDTYNFWYKTRKVSLALLSTVWLTSFADALWAPYATISSRPTISIEWQKSTPTFVLALPF
jgi:tetratricopeptide (TPR) repeat protein